MEGAVIPVDLRGLFIFVRDRGMRAIHISKAPVTDLNEPVAKGNALWWSNCSRPCCIITSWTWVEGAVFPVDLRGLSIFVRDRGMLAIHISKAPVTDLNELVAKGNALWWSNCSRPCCIITSWTWVEGAVFPVDL